MPLSAIDWLSDSVALQPLVVAPSVVAPPAQPVPGVRVLPLDAPVADSVGLFDADEVGLPHDLWGRSAAGDLARLVAEVPPIREPALNRFFVDLLSTRLDPPADAAVDDSLFIARLDALLARAQLDRAKALINAAGEPDPRRFRRLFDISLLTETEHETCRIIETNPDISPTFPARIFCLARNGEFDVAALTLGTAEALGILTPAEDQLLLHFLDPDLFEGDPIPPAPAQITPMVFRLYEAVGERPETETRPVAFAVADLSDTQGWKTRLRAAERLAAAGALSADALIKVMMERKPSASGGIWERTKAVQEFVRAVESEDPHRIGQSLPAVWARAGEGGYRAALAVWAAPRLPENISAHTVFEIGILAGDKALIEAAAVQTREDRALLALMQGRPFELEPTGALTQAIRRALSGLAPGEGYQAMLDDGRPGEALLQAVASLAKGIDADPGAVGDALSLMVKLGLERLAQRVAVELLLEEQRV